MPDTPILRDMLERRYDGPIPPGWLKPPPGAPTLPGQARLFAAKAQTTRATLSKRRRRLTADVAVADPMLGRQVRTLDGWRNAAVTMHGAGRA